jgi:hypothetical protein
VLIARSLADLGVIWQQQVVETLADLLASWPVAYPPQTSKSALQPENAAAPFSSFSRFTPPGYANPLYFPESTRPLRAGTH